MYVLYIKLYLIFIDLLGQKWVWANYERNYYLSAIITHFIAKFERLRIHSLGDKGVHTNRQTDKAIFPSLFTAIQYI